jgi:ubiquinone/menaquinone biosynthesis C-methylase UbiE
MNSGRTWAPAAESRGSSPEEGRGSSRLGGMSASALAYYADGAWYDAEYVHVRYDVPYYVWVAAETQGPILELATGTGRLAIPMAGVGAEVLGIDVVPAMIAEANRKREGRVPAERARLQFVVEDMRTMRLGRTFAAVILGFNTLMHMSEDDDLAATLETARVHLADGGLFHLDIHTPYPTAIERDPNGRFEPTEVVDPTTRERFIVTENNTFDPRTQINTMRFYYQKVDRDRRPIGQETIRELELRVLFPRELDRWLHLAGFRIVGDWDDFERKATFSARGGRRVMSLAKR